MFNYEKGRDFSISFYLCILEFHSYIIIKFSLVYRKSKFLTLLSRILQKFNEWKSTTIYQLHFLLLGKYLLFIRENEFQRPREITRDFYQFMWLTSLLSSFQFCCPIMHFGSLTEKISDLSTYTKHFIKSKVHSTNLVESSKKLTSIQYFKVLKLK